MSKDRQITDRQREPGARQTQARRYEHIRGHSPALHPSNLCRGERIAPARIGLPVGGLEDVLADDGRQVVEVDL